MAESPQRANFDTLGVVFQKPCCRQTVKESRATLHGGVREF
ncbi:MAG TPA: hypothetical protein VHC22_00170 [Pirellulales bacterium]|nr:hypothetical protein [Pirellulales bacterium]